METRHILTAAVLLGALACTAAAPPASRTPLSDIPAEKLTAGGNPKMAYVLVGPKPDAAEPEMGYGLVVVLPAGPPPSRDPRWEMRIRRILRDSLPDSYIVAQPTPVKWTPDQTSLWPTVKRPADQQEFSTEEFVAQVVADVGERHKVDPAHVFVLGWDEGGMAAYAVSLVPQRPVTGAFVAMSDFSPIALPPVKGAEGCAYYIYHSPDDEAIGINKANAAQILLTQKGARAKVATYKGGHGWPAESYEDIAEGIDWLESNASVAPAGGASGVADAGAPEAVAIGEPDLYDGFENGQASPDGWAVQPPLPFVEFRWDAGAPGGGKRCVAIRRDQGGQPPGASWTRTFDRKPGKPRLKFAILIKARAANRVTVLFRFSGGGRTRSEPVVPVDVGVGAEEGRPVTHGWREYSGVYEIPAGSDRISVILSLGGTGEVWFDEIRGEYVD